MKQVVTFLFHFAQLFFGNAIWFSFYNYFVYVDCTENHRKKTVKLHHNKKIFIAWEAYSNIP